MRFVRLPYPFRPQKRVILHTLRARAMRKLMNIQCTSERADKKVWENNGLSGSNSDVVIANENSLDLAFIYPLKCLKKKKKKKNEEEVIFQTRDSKAISKAVSKEESSL